MSAKHYLQHDKFPQCCGATILSGFGSLNEFDGHPTKKEIEAFLMNTSVVLTPVHNTGWHEMERNAFHMAILNSYQKSLFHRLFLKCGFKMTGYNLNTHSVDNNYLYVRKVEHSD